MAGDFDVAVSVWNDFHAPELCEGLARGGFGVLALRSERAPLAGVTTLHSEASRILTRLFQRTQSRMLLELAQNTFETFAARRAGMAGVFWGWNGHNLKGFLAAKRNGARAVCDRGSTHAEWAARRLSEVHRKLGWGPTDLEVSPREIQAQREYKVAEAIIVPSRFVKQTFLECGVPESKLHVNAYGIDERVWGGVRGAKREEGPLVFVFTASMTPRKGVHILLRAWERAGLRDAELWFCGGVHFPIRQLGLPVGENVRFLGYKTHAELPWIYDRASVYVLPSFEEGMARSGLEALAAGLPLIITEETGLTDVMTPGEHGWVVPSGDEDALAETLRQVAVNRDKLGAMSAACQARGLQQTKRAYGDRAAAWLREFLRE